MPVEKRLVTLRMTLNWPQVLQHQNAQLAEYQARQEAKKSRARQALLAHSESQPLPSPLVSPGHPPPLHMGHEMGRGLNFGGQQVIPGHREAAAVSGGN